MSPFEHASFKGDTINIGVKSYFLVGGLSKFAAPKFYNIFLHVDVYASGTEVPEILRGHLRRTRNTGLTTFMHQNKL